MSTAKDLRPMTIGGWIGRRGAGLAERELEATLLAASDLTVKEIARAMCISPSTTEKTLDRAKYKLKARSLRGLVLAALTKGLIEHSEES